MYSNSAYHLLLTGAHGAACAAHVCLVIPKARVENNAPAWLAWPKLIIAAAAFIKIGILAVDLHVVSPASLALIIYITSASFEAANHVSPENISSLLKLLNSPLPTYTLALTSVLIDSLATSLSLTFVTPLVQGIISTIACLSMLCSAWQLLFSREHSTVIVQNRLLSVRQPFTSFYEFTMSIICDTLLDAKLPDTAQVESKDPEYLQEFNEFLFDKHNLSSPLRSLLWTLRRPARIVATLSAMMAVAVCMQAVMLYTALFFLERRTVTPNSAFLHCTLSVGVLYYVMAALEATLRQFTTSLALKLRTSILHLAAEKIFRLSQSAAIAANLESLLDTDLQAFVKCICTFDLGLISTLAICGSIYGLTFIIGIVAYVALALLLVYFGHLLYITDQMSLLEIRVAEKRKARLSETYPILRNLLSIKTLGLQSLYLASLRRLRNEETNAKRMFLNERATSSIAMFLFYPVFVLLILGGLAFQYFDQTRRAEDIYPTLIVLGILGERIAKVKLGVASWTQLRYLHRVMDLLNKDEIPLRFDDNLELNSNTQLRICNLASKHTSKRDTLFLKGVNVEFFRGDFALIYGRTGSGKTTFLQAILGEQMMSAGSIHVADTSLAYCGQATWLPDTSIQLCITGGNPVEETRYRRVIAGCRLPAAMASLSYSVSTKIGSNGCYLSRTERAKMILARAAYAGASIVLLDDSFAVFDTTEAMELARTLLNPTDGLLRVGNATVLLTSHSFAVPDLIDDVYDLATCQFIAYPDTEMHASSENTSSQGSTTTEPSTTIGTPRELNWTSAHCESRCNHKEEAQRVSVQKNLAFIWKTMAKQEDWTNFVLLVLVFVILETPIIVGTVVWPQFHLRMELSVALQTVLIAVYTWAALKLISAIAHNRLTFADTSHEKIATEILTSSPSRTSHLSPAQLLTLLGTDLDFLDSSPYKLFRVSYYLISLIFALALLFWSTNYSLTAVCSAVVCVAVVEHACSGASKRASECSDHAAQKLNSKFTEVTEGLPYIRGFGWEKHMLRQLLSTTNKSEAALSVAISLEPWFDMAMALCWTFMATTIVGYAFCHPDEVHPNTLGLAMLALFELPQMARNMLEISVEIKAFVSATDRIRQFMTADDAISQPRLDPTVEDKDWASVPEIVFENAEIGANPPLSGKICGSGQVLVEGCNGSGKTSLLLALLGTGEYSGSIRVNGVEARDLSNDAIHNLVSILPQDPVALPGTFEDNLFLTQYTDPEKVLEPVDDFLAGILEKLGLVHLTEPDGEGFDRLVSAMRLSEGQIALLNLARCAIDVLGKQTKIVVIDDMFSKLDSEYTDRAKDFIQNAFKACIVVVAETTSAIPLQVKGLTPLDQEYADPAALSPVRRAASNEEVRQYHKARKGKNIPDDAPPPPRPNPPDPFFEPKRPAPRPPPRPPKKKTYTVKSAMAEYTRDTTAPNTRQTRRRRDTNAEDGTAAGEGGAADAPNVGDPANTGGEASDPNPDGSLTARERVMIDALRGIPSEHTRRRDEERRERRRKERESNPGAFPDGEDYDEDDWMYNARPAKPGTVEYQIQQFVIRFMIGFAIVCAIVILLIIFL